MREVVVTGMGAVSALGADCDGLRAALRVGVSGIRPIQGFDCTPFSVRMGAEVGAGSMPGAPGVGSGPVEADRCLAFAVRAGEEALRRAVVPTDLPRHRVGLVFGTGLGDVDLLVHTIAERLARRLDLRGPVLTVCTACSSSTAAIGLARDLVLSGDADMALAGGADVLTPRVFAGFHSLGVLSAEPCAPFSHPFGTSLGEGAGFLVLERRADARRRGAEILTTVAGYGLSADAYHETSPDPRGRGVEAALRAALQDAGLDPDEVDYVNAHGSGTEANDPAEARGILRVLGEASAVPVSSTKGALGHTQGAAGALESIVTLLAMEDDVVPPTLNFAGPRTFAPADPVPGPAPRALPVRHAASLNAAFGGANVALLFSRDERRRVSVPSTRPIPVVGVGVVSRHGLGLDAWLEERGSGGTLRVPGFSLDRVHPRLDPHGLDPSALFLTAAAHLALEDGGRPASGERKRGGLILGAVRPSPASFDAFGRSIDERGLGQVSGPAFARIVLNAPAGSCSKLLGLRGPLTALTVGSASGLAAIVLAGHILRTRPEVPLMVAGAVDEWAEGVDSPSTMPAGEGSACVHLGGVEVPGAPRIVSWGLAGPGRLDDAVAAARAGRTRPRNGEERRFDEGDAAGQSGPGRALPSALAFVAAVAALRRGECSRALVTSGLGSSLSLAVVLEA